MLFMAILGIGLCIVYLPNLGMKTRETSPFAANNVQMRPLLYPPDVSTQLPTEPDSEQTSPSWWKTDEVATCIDKISRAITQETVLGSAIIQNEHLPGRLTYHKNGETFFVEIKTDGSVVVGDLVDRTKLSGTADGNMPNTEPESLSPADILGYKPDIREPFGPPGSIGAVRTPLTAMRYGDLLHLLADSIKDEWLEEQ